MGLSIKDPETERLVRELAARRGTGVTQTVKDAMRAGLAVSGSEDDAWWQAVRAIQKRSCALPVLDARSLDEIAGYDANGAPG